MDMNKYAPFTLERVTGVGNRLRLFQGLLDLLITFNEGTDVINKRLT